jgi:hypothetical protein
VRSGVLKRADNVKSGRGRPKLTWDESVKRDLKEWNISKNLAMDRSAWRLAINVPKPWPLFVLCPLCPFMCLLVSRLFWVLSLAYPNLLGTKDYVVVCCCCYIYVYVLVQIHLVMNQEVVLCMYYLQTFWIFFGKAQWSNFLFVKHYNSMCAVW